VKSIPFAIVVAAALLAAWAGPDASGADPAPRGGAARPPSRLVTCLWFRDAAEEAAKTYCSLLPGSRLLGEMRAGPGGPLVAARFELDGREFLALNGNAEHAFNESTSILVRCVDQAEIDGLWERLTAHGGTPGRCGWLKDRFGVSWQVVPASLAEMLADPDPARARRVADAMMSMGKIDLAALRRAHEGR
jgi:predicted 3-demethylubiquinone-9 3-methyltransferase (glyoxalase superfamily)